jgi:hypothetical protein
MYAPLRSFSFLSPAKTILVPGIYFFGLRRYTIRVSSPHVMPFLMLASVYLHATRYAGCVHLASVHCTRPGQGGMRICPHTLSTRYQNTHHTQKKNALPYTIRSTSERDGNSREALSLTGLAAEESVEVRAHLVPATLQVGQPPVSVCVSAQWVESALAVTGASPLHHISGPHRSDTAICLPHISLLPGTHSRYTCACTDTRFNTRPQYKGSKACRERYDVERGQRQADVGWK